ncbi:MAG: PHP domain-containing protein [Terriglobia bacterium]
MSEPVTLNGKRYLKADLHCHSYFSGKTNHVKALEPMDCYSSPLGVYRRAKSRGMDLVTITDHDSIEGCLNFLEQFPEKIHEDFFIGEEVTARLPQFGAKVHIAVYDITEAQHQEITRLKGNFDELVPYLRSQKVIYVLNHIFHDFPKQQYGARFIDKMLESFEIFEGLNGAIGPTQNGLVSYLITRNPGKILVAGSDSHTLVRLGTCFTLGKGEKRGEFLQSLRTGEVAMAGQNGRFTDIFGDAMGVYLAYFRDLSLRNQVHAQWSPMKKVRNGFGWLGYLPVFFVLSLSYSFIYYQLEKRKYPYYRQLIEEATNSR